jgi:hypothetical protein
MSEVQSSSWMTCLTGEAGLSRQHCRHAPFGHLQ